MASEFYELTRLAFIESLDAVGIPITYAGLTKRCITGPIKRTFDWQQIGFFEDATVRAEMLDTDYDQFSGVEESNATLIVDDIVFRLLAVDREPQDPTVQLTLRKDK
jgi:hypothetical protein